MKTLSYALLMDGFYSMYKLYLNKAFQTKEDTALAKEHI